MFKDNDGWYSIHFIFSENCTSPCSVLIMNLCKLTMHPDENKEMKK